MSDELDRLAAACLSPSFPGTSASDEARRWVARGLGGITLFAENVGEPGQLRGLTDDLRSVRPDLLFSVDEEGGDVTRLEARGGSSYPGNLALGAVDDVAVTRAVAAEIAGDLADAGIGLNLAPVADVNTNPDNPVIGVRSFGSDPALVARHVAAFVEGTQSRGVWACAKHFPGHGDTAVDSHVELPVVGGDLDAALEPFRAAFAAGVRAVMTGHLLVPALDDVPATTSPAIVEGLLRRELDFEGLVLSDALDMHGISAGVGVEEAAVQALAAGVDLLCLGHGPGGATVEGVHAAICAAVQEGRLPLARLAEAAARVGARGRHAVEMRERDRGMGLDAARRALSVHGRPALTGAPVVVELAPPPNVAAGEHEHGLAGLSPGAVSVRLGEIPPDPRALVAPYPDRPVVLVVRDAARHEWQRRTVSALVALRPDAVVVETGLPGWRAEAAAATIETRGASRVSLLAALELLTG